METSSGLGDRNQMWLLAWPKTKKPPAISDEELSPGHKRPDESSSEL